MRKIVLFLTYSVLERGNENQNDVSRLFLKKAVAKCGLEKVKEFFEIQLMHQNELSLKFLDYIDGMQKNDEQEEEKGLNMPKINIDKLAGGIAGS